MGFSGETLVYEDVGLREELRQSRNIVLVVLARRSIRHFSQLVPSWNSTYNQKENAIKTLARIVYRFIQGAMEAVATPVSVAALGFGLVPSDSIFRDDESKKFLKKRRRGRRR